MPMINVYCFRISIQMDNVKEINISTENKYSSIGHHEQKSKKTTGQVKFLAVTVRQRIKLVL